MIGPTIGLAVLVLQPLRRMRAAHENSGKIARWVQADTARGRIERRGKRKPSAEIVRGQSRKRNLKSNIDLLFLSGRSKPGSSSLKLEDVTPVTHAYRVTGIGSMPKPYDA
jgi:hypothetical protein